VAFCHEAHIVPQSLGGKLICTNVCDSCNASFGRKNSGRPAIEEVLKETFGITRMMFLLAQNLMGKNKPGKRFSSTYFKVDMEKRLISTKASWRLQPGFQRDLSTLFRRGIYKMFLEAVEADSGTARDAKYDFIREFARYGLGDYPVFYFLRRLGVVLILNDHIEHPELLLSKYRMKYLLDNGSFLEFELLGHVFGIPTSRRSDLVAEQYFGQTHVMKKDLFCGVINVEFFNDVDLPLNMLKEDGGYERWIASNYGRRLRRF